jgi:hypothetical protein
VTHVVVVFVSFGMFASQVSEKKWIKKKDLDEYRNAMRCGKQWLLTSRISMRGSGTGEVEVLSPSTFTCSLNQLVRTWLMFLNAKTRKHATCLPLL